MSNQLSKRPNMVLFWIVLTSGVAVVLVEQTLSGASDALSLISRTVFWCAAVAYFSVRIYQFALRKRERKDERDPGGDQL